MQSHVYQLSMRAYIYIEKCFFITFIKFILEMCGRTEVREDKPVIGRPLVQLPRLTTSKCGW